MEITLTPEHEQFIHEKIESGVFPSADEVIRASLNHYKTHDAEYDAKIEALRKELAIGLEQSERGDGEVIADLKTWAEETKARGRALLAQRQTERQTAAR